MIGVSGKTSLGMPNLLESRFALPKPRVLRVLMPKCCYVVLMLSHDPSQNLGVDDDAPFGMCGYAIHSKGGSALILTWAR